MKYKDAQRALDDVRRVLRAKKAEFFPTKSLSSDGPGRAWTVGHEFEHDAGTVTAQISFFPKQKRPYLIQYLLGRKAKFKVTVREREAPMFWNMEAIRFQLRDVVKEHAPNPAYEALMMSEPSKLRLRLARLRRIAALVARASVPRYSQGLMPVGEVPVRFLRASQPFEVKINGKAYIDLYAWEQAPEKHPDVEWWLKRLRSSGELSEHG